MNGIPWVLVAILVTLVLLGIIVVVAIRKRKEPRRIDYRSFFVMGVVFLASGVFLRLLAFLHEEVSLSMDGFFIVMGLAYTIIGLVNREKWGKQVEVPATRKRNMMIAILVLALLVIGMALFVVYR